ncbi:DUF4307 domain-containing protein [Sphaerisporangium fuscum]|uniref:DUF4307 domain-containing protein n=1 Tax=Sphaerisporangium fuscum TaxID=2835868 RepID=UPI001BDC9149|nr:DUF4307 domain-containing protein [Sphaerisporangium fuscum]
MTDSGVGQGSGRPVLGTPDSFPERPGRFGRTGRSIALIIIGIFIAIAMGGWGYVMMSMRGNPDVPTDVIAFDVSGPTSVTITFQAHKPADREAVCRLRAVDTEHVEVGTRDVTLPKGRSDVQLTERLQTSAQATSGHVQYCYLVQ